MQSKKRSEGPPTTLTNGFYDNGYDHDEYALLGNQDKFTENVKYKLRERMREVSPPKQMRMQKVKYFLDAFILHKGGLRGGTEMSSHLSVLFGSSMQVCVVNSIFFIRFL